MLFELFQLALWKKSYDNPQMKPLQRYFHSVLFIQYVVLSLWTKSRGFAIQMKHLQQYFHMILFIQYEILWCDHSNETSSALLSHGTIYLLWGSYFGVCGWNPIEWPFKWNIFSSTFTWYYLFSMRSYGVTIQMKPLQHYFHMVLFIYYEVLTFESVDEIL